MDSYPSWQKLEPHFIHQDPSLGIKAIVYDPLWLLTRQWQLGEFEGEDSGSPISVKVENRQGEVSGVFQNTENIFKYDGSMPLEVFVESTRLEVETTRAGGGTEPQLDLRMQVKLGLQLHREIDKLLSEILGDTSELRRFKRFLAQDPDLGFELNEKQDKFETEVTKKYVSTVKGRVINVYKATPSLDSPAILIRRTQEYFEAHPNTDPSVPAAVEKGVQNALGNLKIWWFGNGEHTNVMDREESFFEIPSKDFSFWNPRQLEYDFKVQITPKDDSGNLLGKLVLDASGYREDHLEWHSFALSDESTQGLELPLVSESPDAIATRLKFVGMPEKRWWNFEDTNVDFGSINPKKNDITSILLMEFALVYSPDWYIVPCKMSVGSINKIEKLAVKDCFGNEILIEPAGRTRSELSMKELDTSWDSWSMFTLSEKYKDRDRQHNTPYFFLPPTIDHVLTGPPLEEIKMLRDETSNLVWAVEKVYRTYYGEPISGYDQSVLLQNKTSAVQSDGTMGADSDKPLKYRLMTSVPRNWIPFIPVHVTKSIAPIDPLQKHIELQRASMINPTDQTCIRPNSRLLNEVESPYYIDEAEIPRSGIYASESCQMTIWHSGETFLWIGRKKYYGAGEGSSGLQFDTISENN